VLLVLMTGERAAWPDGRLLPRRGGWRRWPWAPASTAWARGVNTLNRAGCEAAGFHRP